MNFDFKEQANFFNVEKHRFSVDKIQRPPLHCVSEIQMIINLLPKKSKNKSSILDFGAGSGRLSIPLLQTGYRVTAYDISINSLVSLKQIAKEIVPQGDLKIISRLENAKRYNFIVGTDILHHINLEIELRKIYRLLKPGGKICFSEPCGSNPFWYLYLPLTAPWEIEKGVMQIKKSKLTHMFESAGFKNISIQGLGLLPRPLFNFSRRLSIFNDRLGESKLLSNVAYRYLISASK